MSLLAWVFLRRSESIRVLQAALWMIFIPLIVSGLCTFCVNQATFPEVSLHVRIVKAVSSSVGSSPKVFLTEGGEGEQSQREFAITILNVGSLPADREDNVLNIKFRQKIDEVYMADIGRVDQGADGDAEGGAAKCENNDGCRISWQTVDPRGQVNMRFAFSDKSAMFDKLPYIAHAGKSAEKWICCGMSENWVEQCEKKNSQSWMPNFRTWFMSEVLVCPQL